MTKLLTSALAIVACFGTTAMVTVRTHLGAPIANRNAESQFASDGAFRDGLYLGRLAAARGQASRPALGRWSTTRDRSMFVAGYRSGYGESGVNSISKAVRD
ncbi:MAG: hypothetical protein ACRD3Q_21345 [Terriglobales bacterium]